MSDQQMQKVVIVATHGPDDAELATLPFMMGTAAQVMEKEAVIILQGRSVQLAVKHIMDHVFAGGLPPLKGLIETFMEEGGKLLVCTPCVEWRQIETEKLIAGSELIAGARVIAEITSAKAVLTY
jgi:predicted peroxiredoxin